MRLRLAGKIVVFTLVLAGLYALWQRVPPGWRGIRVPHGAGGSVPNMGRLPPPPPEPRHAQFVLSYAGSTPFGKRWPTLETALGMPVKVETGMAEDAMLNGLRHGGVDAAVVNFPDLVKAVRNGPAPFRIVLLARWSGEEPSRTPYVLVVSDAWREDRHGSPTALVKGWLAAPAPQVSVREQRDFMGLGEGKPGYMDWVVTPEAARTGEKPPMVPVDNQPLEEALASSTVIG